MDFFGQLCSQLLQLIFSPNSCSTIIIKSDKYFACDATKIKVRPYNGPFPFYMKFEKNRNRQKYHHSLKEHPMFSKIAKFGCEML